MNVTVTWEGTNITTSTISYSRQTNICTGISTLDLVVSGKVERAFTVWDSIVISENGSKVGTFNIGSVEREAPGGSYIIACQDDSKRLTDYFISEPYDTTYVTTTRYWLEFFLNLAGASYNINTTSLGNNVAPNTSFGMQPAYDVILTLLQMSGWYMYFDEDGTCQIGKLSTASGMSEDFDDTEIIEMSYRKNDKMLRNRAVVWGAGNAETGEQVFADTSVITAWNRPGGDYRTVVYSNPAIETIFAAYGIAYQILAELSLTIPEKNLVVEGLYPNLTVGDRVSAASDFMRFNGMITTLLVNVEQGGAVTTLTLDQRCPRIFGYYSYNDFVYIGTEADGVWRKPLELTSWTNYSTGITDLGIKDLSVYDGLLACVTKNTGELFLRHTTMGAWRKYTPLGFEDVTASGIVIASGVLAQACSIDRTYGINGMVTAAYTLPGSGTPYSGALGVYDFPPSGNRSWLIGVDLYGNQLYNQQIKVILPNQNNFESYDIAVLDLETNLDGNNILSVICPGPLTHIRYSGEPAVFDYGSANIARSLAGYDSLASTYGAPGIYTHLPEPTSGITLEERLVLPWGEVINPSGFTVVDVSVNSQGSLYFEDSLESDGIVYGFRDYPVGASSEIATADYLGEKWDSVFFNGDHILGTNETIQYEYRIDETHYSVMKVYMNSYNGDAIFTIYFITLDPETSTFTVTSAVEKSLDYMYGDAAWDSAPMYRMGIGAYFSVFGINYIKDFESVPWTYFQHHMFNMVTGGCERTDNMAYMWECIRKRVKSGKVCGYPRMGNGSVGVNQILYSYKLDFETPPSLPVGTITNVHDWSIVYCLAKRDGTFAWGAYGSTVYSTLALPDDPDISMSYWRSDTIPHGKNFFQVCYENPDGGGLALLVSSTVARAELRRDTWPEETVYQYVTIKVALPGGQFIENPRVWMNPDDWMKVDMGRVYPTFSRNLSQTPIVCPNYGGFVAMLSPTNWDNYVAVTQFPDWMTPPITVDFVASMMDDYDDYIFMKMHDSNPTGTRSSLCAYDLSGNLQKIILPGKDYSDITYVIQDKLVLGESSVAFLVASGKVITVPSQLNTHILYNVPTISGEFTVIYTGNNPIYVEAGKGTPTVIYKHPALSDLYPSGTPGDFEFPSPLIGASYLNEVGSFEKIYPACPVYDARVFDLSSDGSDFLSASGGEFIPSSLDRYIGVAGGKKGVLMFDSLFEERGYSTIERFGETGSGVVTHVDFTNNHTKPYVFCCLDGAASSGIAASGRFYQRDDDSMIFEDHSVYIPGSPITIIRADDRM